jgi:hypothetical protein
MSDLRCIAGRNYELIFGSDVKRDGVFWELSELTDGVRDIIAEAFFYDELGYVVFNTYRLEIPYSLIKWLHDAVLEEGWPIEEPA